jgi:protein Mpv17
VAIDQLLWNPVFGTLFFGYMGLAQGDNFDQIKTRIKNDLFTQVRSVCTRGLYDCGGVLTGFPRRQVKGSWTVWPIAHAINFRFIPSEQRLLYINSIQIGYNCFLSVLANKGKEEKAAA